MALLADKSADVNSNLVTGMGTESVTYTVPGNVQVKVESVVATVTNAAAVAVTPELTIRDQSGVVIARKAQRLTIPVGDSGTATFALRLDDDAPGTAPAPGPEFSAYMATLIADHAGSCLGYWRLGEGASPFADTSGYFAGAADAIKQVAGTAMTDSIVGALPPADDDGAVQFNNSTGGVGDHLRATGPAPAHFNIPGAAGDGDFTVQAWVKPLASASSFTGQVAGCWIETLGLTDAGWRLAVNWPSRSVWFQRENNTSTVAVTVSGGVLAANTWAFVVGTYDATNKHRIYINGTLVATDSTTIVAADMPSSNDGVRFGRGQGVAVDGFYGGVDEVAVWDLALSATEIVNLWETTL